MSSALYIVLEREGPGIANTVDGKILSRADQELDPLAKKLGVRPLMDFFGMDPDDVLGELGGLDGEPTTENSLEETWFSATDGLRTVRALLEHLGANPGAVSSPRELTEELAAFEEVLEAAEAKGIRWYLAVDY